MVHVKSLSLSQSYICITVSWCTCASFPFFLLFLVFYQQQKNRDSDHDGRITVEQIKSVFQRLPERPTEDEIEELIDLADTDRDGMINFDDLMNMLDSYKPH